MASQNGAMRLNLTNDGAVLTDARPRMRGGNDKTAVLALTLEVPIDSLSIDDVGKIVKAKGRTMTLTVSDPQLAMALGT